MTDEQIETALNACMFGQTKADRCKDCPLDSEKEPCITNLHLAALEYIGRLKHRAEVAERALNKFAENVTCEDCPFFSDCSSSEKMKDSVHSNYCFAEYLKQAEKELAEGRKDVE